MTSQKLAAIAAFSLVVAGVGCSKDDTHSNPKPGGTGGTARPTTGTGGATTKPPTTGTAGTTGAGGTTTAKPPTAGTGGTAGAGGTTGGTTAKPPTAGTGGTAGAGGSTPTTPPPSGTAGTTGTGGTTPTTPPPTGTGGTTTPPKTGAAGMTGTGGTTPIVVGPTTPTTPPPPPTAAPLRIAAFGDYGADNSHEADVAALVHSWKPDHVLTTGDNNYSDGEASTIDANVGKYYHDFIGNYRGSYGAGSATNRFWPSPGNHDWVATDLKPYTDYFTLPGNERYYDVDLGLVHLYAIDSDSDEPDGNTATEKQALWLKERLAASKSCFDLVYFHHPSYSTGDEGSRLNMRWPFEEWGAESVLTGHDHHYERLQVGGIPYFVVGTGGAGRKPFDKPALPETKFRDADTYGAMLITATTTGITFEFWSQDGKKLDSLNVPKTCR